MRICFATNNQKKIAEVQSAIGDSLTILSLSDIGCKEELPETGATLEANALEKASFVKEKYGIDCFADDTGLEVYALGGAPGVYSGRFAGEPRSDEKNINLLLKKMEGLSERKARFKTVFSLLLGENQYAFEGIAEGEITTERSGSGGFGYDPVFKPKGMNKTFAELTMEEKNEISHRGQALRQLLYFLGKL